MHGVSLVMSGRKSQVPSELPGWRGGGGGGGGGSQVQRGAAPALRLFVEEKVFLRPPFVRNLLNEG